MTNGQTNVQSKQIVSLQNFLREIVNMFSVFLSSYRKTGGSLEKLEKAVETLSARVPTAFLVLANFHSCFY